MAIVGELVAFYLVNLTEGFPFFFPPLRTVLAGTPRDSIFLCSIALGVPYVPGSSAAGGHNRLDRRRKQSHASQTPPSTQRSWVRS